MNQEQLSIMALHLIPGIGNWLIKYLIQHFGSASVVFRKSKEELKKVPGIGEVTSQAIKQANVFTQAEQEFIQAEREETQIIFFTDDHYPQRLALTPHAPCLLYYKGECSLNPSRTIGIVGTRDATAYGKKVVEQFIKELTPYQPVIISGLAYGIDIYAHNEALRHALKTISVMGTGLDSVYPAAHRNIVSQIVHQGGLLSELTYGTKPLAHNFPARNRILAGLSDALIIVESALRGGAMITARLANDYHRDVFTIPGNIGNLYSEGCNQLIKTHQAHLITSADDLIKYMNWDTPSSHKPHKKTMTLSLDLDANEKTIIDILYNKKDPVIIDEIIALSHLAPGAVAFALLGLEFKNLVKPLPGKTYQCIC